MIARNDLLARRIFAGKSTTIISANIEQLRFLIGILNSKLMSYYYKQSFSALSLSGGYMRIGPPQLKQLPIRKPSKVEQLQIGELVNKIIVLYSELNLFNRKKTNESKRIQYDISILEKKLDKAVYQIYGLSEEQISVIENELGAQ